MFALLEPVPGAPAPPGPWVVRPALVSFSLNDPTPPTQIWRADLRADPLVARVELGVAGDQLRTHETALTTAETRMGQALFSGASFSHRAAPGIPEQQLQTLLFARGDSASTGGTSFSTRDAPPADWDTAETQFRAFVAQARETISAFAIVETRLGEHLVGRTRVNWGGDTRTYLIDRVEHAQAALHRRALALAIRSRAAILRVFTTVLRGARIIAQMISSPIGTITALPAAWKFIDELLREARKT